MIDMDQLETYTAGSSRHRHSPHTQQSLLRRDLVSERFTDLSTSKGNTAVIEIEKTTKVDKVSLGSLGSEVSVEQRIVSLLLYPRFINMRSRLAYPLI
jgi:hypothetical protein